MRTVEAVTAPFVAEGPTAVTQSPTARSVDAAAWVDATVVDADVVILRFWVFGVSGLAVLELFELLELEDLVPAKLPDRCRRPTPRPSSR